VRTSLRGPFGEAREAIREIRKEIVTTPTSAPGAADSDLGGDATSTAPAETDGTSMSFLRRLADWPWSESSPPLLRSEAASAGPISVRIEPDDGGILHVLETVLVSAMGPLATLGMVTVFLVFLLIQREELRDRLICLLGRGHLNLTTEALDDAAGRVSRYLFAQVVTNVLYGLVIALGLALIGVPRAAFWGLLATLLRFVPYLGTVVAAALPLVLSLAVFVDWVRPLLVLALFVGLDLAVVNVLESWLFGARTGVTPIAIVGSAVFWTWLWGGLGLFLATPLAACFVVLGRHVPQWAFLSVLLGDQPALTVHMRFYRRLLSLDELGAAETLREAQREMPPAELYDAVILPALWEAEHDRRRGVLSGRREAFIRETITDLVEALHAPQSAGAAPTDPAPSAADESGSTAGIPDVLCVPARSRMDEVTARILAGALRHDGLRARVSSSRTLAGELIETVRTEAIPIVCVCGVYPSSFKHVRYLCKRLRKSAPGAVLAAALWTGPRSVNSFVARLAADLDVDWFTQLHEARRSIAALARRPKTGDPAAASSLVSRRA
jgi:predicted PurR-regulated permease PerM